MLEKFLRAVPSAPRKPALTKLYSMSSNWQTWYAAREHGHDDRLLVSAVENAGMNGAGPSLPDVTEFPEIARLAPPGQALVAGRATSQRIIRSERSKSHEAVFIDEHRAGEIAVAASPVR